MYPRISDLLRELFGINIPLPIQTYGFFVAAAFLTGIWLMSLELKRKEKEGLLQTFKKKFFVGEGAKPKDLIISGLIGFIIGYKLLDAVFNYNALVANPQEFILNLKGSIIGGILGAGLSVFMTYRDKNKQKLDKPHWETRVMHPYQITGNILMVAGVFGLLGAKLFAILEEPSAFIADPIGTVFSFSGLTYFGGLLVGSAAVYFYVRKYNIKGIHLLDIAAIVMPLAYAVGRIGCQVSGDGCWGIVNIAPQPEWLAWLPEWTWAYDYPHNINNDGVHIAGCSAEIWNNRCNVLPKPVFPTPFYETSIMVVIFGITSFLKKRIKIAGMLFGIYLILAGLERFFIEKIRHNIDYEIFSFKFTQAELISFLMFASGVILIVILLKKNNVLKKTKE